MFASGPPSAPLGRSILARDEHTTRGEHDHGRSKMQDADDEAGQESAAVSTPPRPSRLALLPKRPEQLPSPPPERAQRLGLPALCTGALGGAFAAGAARSHSSLSNYHSQSTLTNYSDIWAEDDIGTSNQQLSDKLAHLLDCQYEQMQSHFDHLTSHIEEAIVRILEQQQPNQHQYMARLNRILELLQTWLDLPSDPHQMRDGEQQKGPRSSFNRRVKQPGLRIDEPQGVFGDAAGNKPASEFNGPKSTEKQQQGVLGDAAINKPVSECNGSSAKAQVASSGDLQSKTSASSSKLEIDASKRSQKSLFTSIEDEDDQQRKSAKRHGEEVLADFNEDGVKYTCACQRKLQKFVSGVYFESFFALAIVSNSVVVGVQVDANFSNPLSATSASFEVVQNVYAVLFLIELVFRISALGFRAFFCSKTSWHWNFLDTFIVLCSILEFSAHLADSASSGPMSNMSSLRIMRIIRMTRVVRVFRISRIVRFFRAMQTLLHSIAITIKQLVWAILLLTIFIYMFAILFTQAAIDYITLVMEEESATSALLMQYWSSVPTSMITLFESIASGVSWDIVMQPLLDISWVWGLSFIIFIIFSYFAVLNVVTGVFCQAAIESAQHDQDLLTYQHMKNKDKFVKRLEELFGKVDYDNSGTITIHELETYLSTKEVREYFNAMEIEISDVWTLFKLLDRDADHELDVEEFVTGCLKLKGSARSLDIAQLSIETQWLTRNLLCFMHLVERQLGIIVPTYNRSGTKRQRSPAEVSRTHQQASRQFSDLGYGGYI